MGTFVAGPPKLGRYHLLESVSSKTFTPREYQVELLDAAKEKNTIVCLGTGAGKTFIAIMLIKELAFETRHSYDDCGKRTFFLVPTVPLVHQQAKVIEDYTDLKVAKLCGTEINVKSLQPMLEEIKLCNVVVSTPDIIKMLIHHGCFPVSKINLLIFDECHRAVKRHPYCEIMQCFDVCPPEDMPRILGLSASLINNKCKPMNIQQEIQSLEFNLKSTVQTASELTMLSKYGSKPAEYFLEYPVYYDDSDFFSAALSEINSAVLFLNDLNINDDCESDSVHPCKQPRKYLVDLGHVLKTLGPWCALHAYSLFFNEMKQLLDIPFSNSYKYCFSVALTVLEKVAVLCKKYVFSRCNSNKFNILDSAPPQLKELAKLLMLYKPGNVLGGEKIYCDIYKNFHCTDTKSFCMKIMQQKSVQNNNSNNCGAFLNVEPEVTNQDSQNAFIDRHYSSEDAKSLCCILFVRQRITAFLLNLWLTELSQCHEDFEFLCPNFIIGHGNHSDGIKHINLASHKQEEILQKFRIREYNIIITTSIAEEGLDIPRCNLIIRFDPPENFRAYVQSKGRARASDSTFVTMVCSADRVKIAEDFCDFKAVEEVLLTKSHRLDYTDEIVNQKEVDKLIEPYMPIKEVGSPRVTLTAAIALVNRYCAKLPSDTFTRLTAKWKIKEISEDNSDFSYQCVVKLPINSPMKKAIAGQPMGSKQLAKMAAALQTCIELHKIGELDDNFLPAGKESVKFEEDFSIDNEVIPENCARPGTTKRRQYYFKQVADALKFSVPKCGQPCFLYMFRMILTCPIPEEQNTRGRKIHDPEETSRNFGVVLSKPIPPICSFPVFTRSGEVTIEIEPVSSNLILNETEFQQLAQFHKYTFSDVLRLEKYPMMFCPEESESSYFIVPVNICENTNISYEIDWEFVHIIQKHTKPKKLREEERKLFEFKETNYTDAVVMPWYRNLDKPQFFYVAEICSNLSPISDFPDAGYGSFKGYYEQKYNLSIANFSQPLLDVDHTSARLNLLTPRYVNRKGVTLPTSSENTKKTKRENLQQKQILVPELCIVHPFPASLWRKAVCLPCILYRTNALLLAEQLRTTVARDICVGMEELPDNFEWPILDFGWTLADVLKCQAGLQEETPVERVHTDFNTKNCSQNSVGRKSEIINANKKIDISFKNPTHEDMPHTNTYIDDVAVITNDFEIDVFDPSKCYIPESDEKDDLFEQELNNINFAVDNYFGTPVVNTSMWHADEASSNQSEPFIRYGSPSNFENGELDSEWEIGDNTNFFSLNLPDIGYISAPGIFDMQSFSIDLANQREETDFPDNSDELSTSDDEVKNEILNENIYGNEEKSALEATDECKYYCDFTKQFSVTSANSINFSGSAENLNTPKHVEDVIQSTSFRRPVEKNGIKCINFKCEEYIEMKTQSPICSKIISNDEQMCYEKAHLCDKKCIMLNDRCLLNEHMLNDANNEETKFKRDDNSVLAFGELLPNREQHNEHESTYDDLLCFFDDSPDLTSHPGPSPSMILQAFTMSNANDGINLERLETVGDSFLKYAITAYLFCMFPNIHEGKLSFLRSKQISNLNLYKLGKRKHFGELMVASKFEPNDNWLPPCYVVPKGLEQALIESGIPVGSWNIRNLCNLTSMSEEEIRHSVIEKKEVCNNDTSIKINIVENICPVVPYNLLTQHSIPDKSIADCVEALIGAYLVSCGARGALLFMSWLGLRVLPMIENCDKRSYGFLKPPPSPLLYHTPKAELKLEKLLSGYSTFESKIGYIFNDKAYLLQAFTHASYCYNAYTDCYQRLEFLGDAVLDYLITRHLYEDPKKHSPGTLTDLRSALVNNTFFASLAVKYDYHKYFKAISPSLFAVINKFVQLKENLSFEDYSQTYYLEEEECEEVEEVEVPKALGDIFESVAGAIYLDSNMSLDAVWGVYYLMMKPEIDYFSSHVPKSPIRELLELEPQTAKFEKAEMTLNGKVRVRVEVFGKGTFVGIGRNKRIAKCTAAKRALRELKKTDDIC